MTMTQLLFSFSGRINRQLYVLGALLLGFLHAAIFYLAAHFYGVNLTGTLPKEMLAADMVIQSLFFWPFLALSYKRMHDRNKSGKLFGVLYIAIAILGMLMTPDLAAMSGNDNQFFKFVFLALMLGVFVILIELIFFRGTSGPNNYGPDPLGGF